MDYLAHALLAGPLASDRVGGVIGDFVKGPLVPRPNWLGAALADGVMLHRRIDSFTEMHAAFRRSRSRVSEGRDAPVWGHPASPGRPSAPAAR
jgi:acyl carrier protein phosphodiesterase